MINESTVNEEIQDDNIEEQDEIIEEQDEETDDNQEISDLNDNEENESLNNKLLRLQADFLNYKKRTEKEKFTSYSNAVSDTIKDLLPVIDNLERAIDSTNSSNENLYDGVKMIYNQFIEILNKKGLKEIEALNKKFDPNMHYGVAYENKEDVKDDTIVEVFQKGYLVNDRVIRPSMVKISKK